MGGRKFWQESALAGPGSINERKGVDQYTNFDRWHPGILACTKSQDDEANRAT